MHPVGLTLMTEKAGGRRELDADAHLLVASKGLQMRVHILAGTMLGRRLDEPVMSLLVVALQRRGFVVAPRLPLVRAVIFSVVVRLCLIEWVAPSELALLLLHSLRCDRIRWRQ
jgi:hypothetical protein